MSSPSKMTVSLEDIPLDNDSKSSSKKSVKSKSKDSHSKSKSSSKTDKNEKAEKSPVVQHDVRDTSDKFF